MSKVRGEPEGSEARREALGEERGGDSRRPATMKQSKRPSTTVGYHLGKTCKLTDGSGPALYIHTSEECNFVTCHWLVGNKTVLPSVCVCI